MSRTWAVTLLAMLFAASTGCDTGPHAATGFRLPQSGSAERGKVAFAAFRCNNCHGVNGVDFSRPAGEPILALGGPVARPVTDGFLVTSIINPSHSVDGHVRSDQLSGTKSPMPDFADRMTVRDLTDLVAFLQSRYTVQTVHTSPVVY